MVSLKLTINLHTLVIFVILLFTVYMTNCIINGYRKFNIYFFIHLDYELFKCKIVLPFWDLK